ncbi:GATA transcription factor 9 [Hibiscus syriacus]|uniref:GATA transcription factor 9 n=1 Tax=Hibiscus syriacus TaxID=106335 RepID=A0A6A3CYF2_HIBSY|nr:GATA transcription factor 9 [Hibiscus syriacus]
MLLSENGTGDQVQSSYRMASFGFSCPTSAEGRPLDVGLQEPVTIGCLTLEQVENMVVRVELNNGCVGWGEITVVPWVNWNQATILEKKCFLEANLLLAGLEMALIDAIYDYPRGFLTIECRILDVETKMLGMIKFGLRPTINEDGQRGGYRSLCDESTQLNQQLSTTKAASSTSRSITLHSESIDVKGSTWFQTSGPVTVLESSNSSSGTNPTPINPKLGFPVKRGRSKSKCRRASNLKMQFTVSSISSTSSASRGSDYLVGSESESESHHTEKPSKKKQKKKMKLTLLSGSSEIKKSSSQQPTACLHCEVTETPQWREGPMGPKTLCNACGVRYRSGRLFPEYRPAASPTFVPSVHSNSHKKVVEMRKRAKQPPQTTFR